MGVSLSELNVDEEDSEDDVDFVPNSASSSDSDNDAGGASSAAAAPPDASQYEAESHIRLAALDFRFSEEMRKLQEARKFTLRSCARVDAIGSRAASPSENFSLTVEEIRKIRLALDASMNRMTEKRVRFAGKDYIVQISANGHEQRLVAEESIPRSTPICAEGSGWEHSEYIPPSVELTRLATLAGKLKNSGNASAAQQVSAMFKSKADWRTHVEQSKDEEDLEEHRKGQGALLHRKRFLEKVNVALMQQQQSMPKRRR